MGDLQGGAKATLYGTHGRSQPILKFRFPYSLRTVAFHRRWVVTDLRATLGTVQTTVQSTLDLYPTARPPIGESGSKKPSPAEQSAAAAHQIDQTVKESPLHTRKQPGHTLAIHPTPPSMSRVTSVLHRTTTTLRILDKMPTLCTSRPTVVAVAVQYTLSRGSESKAHRQHGVCEPRGLRQPPHHPDGHHSQNNHSQQNNHSHTPNTNGQPQMNNTNSGAPKRKRSYPDEYDQPNSSAYHNHAASQPTACTENVPARERKRTRSRPEPRSASQPTATENVPARERKWTRSRTMAPRTIIVVVGISIEKGTTFQCHR